jgi:hypothetical protein
MDFDDPILTLAREAERHARLFQDPTLTGAMREAQFATRLIEESGVMKYMREAQEHQKLWETITGSQWMSEVQLATRALEDFGITREPLN